MASSDLVELTIPSVGESVVEVQIAKWLKKEGDAVAKDEDVAELESEKANVPLVAQNAGVLEKIVAAEGEFVKVGSVAAYLNTGGKASAPAAKNGDAGAKPAAAPSGDGTRPTTPPPAPATSKAPAPHAAPAGAEAHLLPAAERLIREKGLDPSKIPAQTPGRLTKEDVLRHLETAPARPSAPATPSVPVRPLPATIPSVQASHAATGELATRREESQPMTMLRRTIATRLVQAQQTAALLTTFNEIDMFPVMELRKKHKDGFEQRHGAKLGFMSFFTKATVEALKRYPAINAEVRENHLVYKKYYDIGIAIGSGKGLVVPVLRDCDTLSFADVEKGIAGFAAKAKDGKLAPSDMEGGTFTITNGGVYGSLMSTPIVNPPQSGVLGLHAIQDRPIALDGQVVIRPMMYVALTYDHRIVDGREAVTFLRTIKELIEDPSRLLLDL
jgi:2-oxoglutarate dehydrogenase E2 component (dihydrolipoamide succinyltransferase)